MILLNFSHPLTRAQIDQVRAMTDASDVHVIDLPVQFDNDQPFEPQLASLAAQIPLSTAELQGEPILVNLPSLNFIAAMLLAELHGRMGYFPPILRMRPVRDSLPPRFELAEIINLNALRESARRKR